MENIKYLLAVLFTFAALSAFVAQTHAASPVYGDLIKASGPSVYYYGADGGRYAFPNEKTYFSWYADFAGVKTVSDAQLASYPLRGNVTYKPGYRLLKITTDPKVYAVTKGGVLRWVQTEDVARALYSANWSSRVDDVPDAFFVNYTLGSPIAAASDYSPATEQSNATSINADKNIGGVPVTPAPTSGGNNILGGCQVFPADNSWNQDVSRLPVRSDSAQYIVAMGADTGLHPDFGEDQTYGIPYNVVPGSTPKVPITFTAYGDESDPGPYPIPANAKVEYGSDHHVLVLDSGECKIYEMYHAVKHTSDSGWSADAGAVWDLSTDARRPEGWTSADEGGLSILAGLVRYDEVASGSINHAIRFTVEGSSNGYIYPATHRGSNDDHSLPPMGLRVRLKADYDISRLTGQARVIAVAMKKYGMIVADDGGPWYFQGATDPRWNDDDLNELKDVPGSAFEVVDTGPVHY